jgi:hypothetical protein
MSALCLTAIMSGVATVSPAYAQTQGATQGTAQGASSGQASNAGPSVSAVGSSTDAAPASNDSTQYLPALNGSGLISLKSMMARRLVVGADVVSGWDSNPENVANGISSGVYIFSPYLGIEARNAKVQFLLQYQPTITEYTSAAGNSQAMHVATATLVGTLSERWKWSLDASGSHGQDSTRLLTSQQTTAVGGVPGIGPGTPAYFANSGMVTFLNGDGTLQYRSSPRSSYELGLSNTLSRYSGGTNSNNIAMSTFAYDRDLSPTMGMRAYEQTYYYYGLLNCTSSGGGVGINWSMRDGGLLSLRGGPQITSSTCGKQQFYSYSASFSKRLSQKQQVYALTSREPAISYLGPGLWVVSTSAGYQRQVGMRGSFNFDVGHASSQADDVQSSYSGTYVDFGYKHTLGHGLNLSYSYRRFSGDTGGVGFTRNVALISLGWAPALGRLFQ